MTSVVCWSVELRVLEDNGQFRSLIADVRMPTMRRGTVAVAGYSQYLSTVLSLVKGSWMGEG